jgi:antitoxin (DNA-binding transcriptional repressor) of toxin-antitoxin stability system
MPVTTELDIRDLPARLDEVLALAAAGHEVILLDGITPRARLVPCPVTNRVAGLHAGVIQTAPDFDAPLPDDFWTGRS